MPARTDLAQCQKCGLNFLNEEGLGKHTKRVHEEKEQMKPSKYKCDRCSDEFVTKDDFKKHKLPEEFSCDLCKQRGDCAILPSKCEYNFHIITHRVGKPKVCDNCGSEFKNNKNLKNHKDQDKTVSCRRCNKIFVGSCPLQKHIRDEHDTKNEPIPPLQRQYGRPTHSQSNSTNVPTTVTKVEGKLDNQTHTSIKTEKKDDSASSGSATLVNEKRHTELGFKPIILPIKQKGVKDSNNSSLIETDTVTSSTSSTTVNIKRHNDLGFKPIILQKKPRVDSHVTPASSSDKTEHVKIELAAELTALKNDEYQIPHEMLPGHCDNEFILGI